MDERTQPQAPDAEVVRGEREPRAASGARVLVVEAADGQDAVDLLQAGLEPDAILLDLSLPRMDGKAFLEWLRAQPQHAHRRVIVASAYLEELPAVGADRTFAKPFRPERLAAELELLTSGE